MSEQTLGSFSTHTATGTRATANEEKEVASAKDLLWALPQPILVLGSMAAVATMIQTEWMNPDLFATIMIVLPIPLLLVAERLWTKRRDWLLEPKEMAEDAFWLAFAAFVWVPIYDDFYETPISAGFKALREISPLSLNLEAASFWGLLGAAVLLRTCSGFIYYWLHRVQHESLFWWRIHATHHHITKMGCMRGDRTHPFEYLALALSTPIVFALLGAGNDVVAVSAAFGMWNGALNHSNLPLKSMPVYDWFFATAQQHHVHHALSMQQSNSNYGCNVILWDRIFGTYCGDHQVEAIGAGTGKPLSLKDQLLLSFYPDRRLTKL